MELGNRRLKHWPQTIICGGLSALLFYFSTGLGEIWLFAWFAPLPLLWLAYSQIPLWRVAVAVFIAFALGNVGFIIPFAGMRAATIGVAMAIISLSAAAAVATTFARFVQRRAGWLPALIAFPALWTAIEYVSSLVSPNGTVGSLAYTQVGVPVLIQSASLVGIWGITFLLCLVANGGALALQSRGKAWPILAVVVAVFGLNLLFGIVRLQQDAGSTALVAVAAKDQEEQRFESTEETWLAITTAYADGINSLSATNPGTTTVVLPEKLATLDPAWRDAVLAPIARAATDNNVRIVAGFIDDAEPAQNIAVTFAPDGTSETYAKRRLLGAEQDLAPGTQPGLLADGTAVTICKDMDFPSLIRDDLAGQSVGMMFVPAEDFFVDRWSHSRVAVMRGVEGDYSVARAARKGDIQVSDNRGRVLTSAASSTDFTARVAVAPVGTGRTLYLIVGDLFAWLCLGAVLVLATTTFRLPRAA